MKRALDHRFNRHGKAVSIFVTALYTMWNIQKREDVLLLYQHIHSMREVGRILNVSASSVCRWCKNVEGNKHVNNAPRKMCEEYTSFIKSAMDENPALLCSDLARMILEQFKVSVSRQLINLIVRKTICYSYKKNRVRGGTPETVDQLSFLRALDDNAGCKLVFVDETGFDSRPHCTYGYSPIGKPAVCRVPQSSDRTRYNLVMGITSDGESHHRISEVPVDGVFFANFIRSMPYPAGTCIILDNSKVHGTADVLRSAADKGYDMLFIPSYSPELNPIEMVFATIKLDFRRQRAKQQPNIREQVHDLATAIDSESIENRVRHFRDEVTKLRASLASVTVTDKPSLGYKEKRARDFQFHKYNARQRGSIDKFLVVTVGASVAPMKPFHVPVAKKRGAIDRFLAPRGS